jgi:hypothetical protein
VTPLGESSGTVQLNSEFLVSHALYKPTLPASTKFNLTLTQRILILTKLNHGQTVFSMEA